MSKMTNEQRRTIYGMATQLGIYEKNNPNDNLHALVYGLTGKESISELTISDAGTVISELIRLKEGQNLPRKSKATSNQAHRPGMITPDQVKKVWYFMYRLAELDVEPSKARLSKRLCGIIEKNLHISAFEKDPFRFVTFDQGIKLIEIVKKLVQNEKRKRKISI
ncbi:MAG: regulatory protein GemA [Firmicutes bacterium]|nr:regulatory protein GemA [Bacillota bacterium]